MVEILYYQDRSRQDIENFLRKWDKPKCYENFNKFKARCQKCDFKEECRLDNRRRRV